MAETYSHMKQLGTRAPDFDLPVANPRSDEQRTVALSDVADAGALVVVFMCNHCPFVVHIEAALVRAARDYQPRGVAFVGINANDAEAYPQDGFERMAERARKRHYPFPYLYDASQSVAKAYGAVCTPDLFVYDRQRMLVYRGRFDATRPGMGEADGRDLRQALDELLATGTVTMDQRPAMGCNIKWRPGSAPA